MDWRYNTIWTEQLSEADFAAVIFNNSCISPADLTDKRYIIATKFKSKSGDLRDFPAVGSVDYLEIALSNVKSFTGLTHFGQLKRLEAHYCLKLESDEGLSEVKDSLEWLHINQSKKFSPGKELASLSKLRVLCLNACAPLPSLEFLYDFPNLVDFRFVDTNVVNGDLTPLLNHPSLCSVGFLNKRHYNLKDTDVKDRLEQRKSAAIEKAFKGEFQTFRYLALGT